ncbi:hypothetical protein M0R36_03715 [bacterium]|jgi:S-adenosylmethionine/arginine decarboxylase-like enzyme|nr:hypothetical protein [bacterium]
MEGLAEERKGVFYGERNAGLAPRRFLAGFRDVKNIYNLQCVESLLKEMLNESAAGEPAWLRAKLLDFARSGCVSGIAVMNRFYLAVYSRPYLNYAAVDIFFSRGYFYVNKLVEALTRALGSAIAGFYMSEGKNLKHKINLNKVYIDNRAVRETEFGGSKLYPDFDAGFSVSPTMSM